MLILTLTLINQLVDENSILITIEENTIGGFGSHVLQYISNHAYLDTPNELKFRSMYIPDNEIYEGDTQYNQYNKAKLNSKHIINTINKLLL